jgi:hypothetical protein
VPIATGICFRVSFFILKNLEDPMAGGLSCRMILKDKAAGFFLDVAVHGFAADR